MSRYFNSFMDDSSEALEHSWGTSPEAKAREKEYNHWYYQKHKDEFAAIRKQRNAAKDSYRQAEKSYDDARKYEALSGVMSARLLGYDVSNIYKDSDGNYRGKATYTYSKHLNPSAVNRLHNAKYKYDRMSKDSDIKSREYKTQGARQKASAEAEDKRIRQGIKNPTVKDLVEFYLDTTVAKVKKSASKAANKAKKYATKAISSSEKEAKKYATKAKKYATKAVSNAEKYATKTVKSAANKAKKYATKTIKSVVR